MPAALPLIRPISDLRTNLNDVCAQAQESRQPIFMTKNGKASLVVIDCDAYEEQRQHDRYVQKLREAEIEAKYRTGTVSQASLDETIARIFEVWGV
ncbi:type II toxin-antitoxin system prevent-host-death family antitoxin [Adlercreutzia sp. ZJ138]|uniref:type II toxin-antitoxin system prevent-host-death family antitoxin n=1 Tax=Adlercreutzia sp. ZJ138 TaxID=2709405 RepID=UPI001F15412A|nr:type II toxin-antitoxin system prevent-host-death family antitoxin [Adlercreutzia sp. ZJ138]